MALAPVRETAYLGIVKFLHRTTRARLLTASLAVPLLMQLLGLNVLCFCGHCPASQILMPAEPKAEVADHACCHHADAADPIDETLPTLAGQSCCGDDHAWRPPTTLAHDGFPPLQQIATAILPIAPLPVPDVSSHALRPSQRFLARGPPPVPIYLQHRSLQI